MYGFERWRMRAYGDDFMETPIFEQTEVFTRGIGEATDVVNKEMFVVRSGENYRRSLEAGTDAGLKGKSRLSLRPEGTAGVVRAVVQHNLVEQGAIYGSDKLTDDLRVTYAERNPQITEIKQAMLEHFQALSQDQGSESRQVSDR